MLRNGERGILGEIKRKVNTAVDDDQTTAQAEPVDRNCFYRGIRQLQRRESEMRLLDSGAIGTASFTSKRAQL